MPISHDRRRPCRTGSPSWPDLDMETAVPRESERWHGQVSHFRNGPLEHQHYAIEFRNALLRNARADRQAHPERCWRATAGTSIFAEDSFLSLDFSVYRCPPNDYAQIDIDSVDLVGQVISIASDSCEIADRRRRAAAAAITWHWEVELARDLRHIDRVTVSAMVRVDEVWPGLAPRQSENYLPVAEWTPEQTPDGIRFDLPFPIQISWEELAF
ncbi:hypothetical protein [Nocardia sp. NPDC048505]|uniref:hypothetical protein n=1 Tax=unclassified Nocardia TaxID=2637762 RepID=UPI0033DF3D9B